MERKIVLYVGNGKLHKIQDLTPQEIDTAKKWTSEQKGEIAFEVRTARQDMLSLVVGRKLSNNWFKMHGGIMRRKRKRRKKVCFLLGSH